MSHNYTNYEDALTPFLITPNDDNFLFTAEGVRVVTRGISFATAGALVIETMSGHVVTIPNGALAAGEIHPIIARKVLSTGNGASGIVGYV